MKKVRMGVLQIKEMDELLCKLLWGQLQSMGLFTEKNPVIADFKIKAGLRDIYDRWLEESIAFLAQNNYLMYDGKSSAVNDTIPVDIDAVWKEWDRKKGAWLKDPNTKAHIVLVEATLRVLPKILTGKVLATDIMFPNSSMELVEGVYKHNLLADYFNKVLADTVVTFIQERLKEDASTRIRILEIGAGTGGTSAMVFQKLKPYQEHIQEYCYTDISKAFLLHAEKEYGPQNPYMTYKIFNVEAPIAGQGISAGGYDIVIAANVLHATKNIRQTLRNAKAALQKNGLILLNEITGKSLFTHLTFGLLEGWWLYEDPDLRIPGSPGLTPETWKAVLESEGFRSVFFPAQEAHDWGQQIVVAESDGVVRQKQQLKPSVTPVKKKGDNTKTSRSHIGHKTLKLSIVQHKHLTLKKTNAIQGNVDVTDQMVEDHVRETIIEKLSKSLKVNRDVIDVDESFADYGVDSITGVNLVQVINQTLMIELETTSLFDYSSVSQLTAYALSKYKDMIAASLRQNVKQVDVNDDFSCENKGIQPVYSYPKRFLRSMVLPEPDIREKEESIGDSIQKDPIAIIGMSGRFAKSKTVNELWKHLSKGTDLIEEVSRWNLSEYYSEETNYCKHGSFLEDIDQFDPLFFKISELEATYMDPQQRIFLEESWKALEDAGYAGTGVKGCLCGVYVGCAAGDYQQLFGENIPAQAFWGNAGSVIPARIAYYLDLQGPAVAVDTACSSSLVAIHLACQGLWAKETEMALAGGVFIQSTPWFYLNTNRAGMLSSTGRCYTFDDRADGFVPGEGVGVVVLKRLKEAIADGDHIYGVIRGSGINQDGTTNGITAPSAKSQERLECHVYDTFNIHPEQIQMVEAHGTGTKLGDPIEYEALTRAFRKYTDRKEYCAIGSIKTNIGHAATAAGIAGLIKILLSLQHKQIPPSLHFQSGNSNIQFKDSPFYVNTSLKDWDVGPNSKRCAVISSFGFSGTNAHMAIEEAPEVERRYFEKPGYLIVLSALAFEQLQQQVEQLIKYCEREPQVDCGNMSYTLLLGRKHFKHRLACIVRSRNELVALLKKWLEKGKVLQIYVSELHESDHREQPSLKRYGNQCVQNCQKTDNVNEYLELLSTIAELYVQGYELEFEQLFSKEQYFRISLPTYPFAKERYWIPGNEKSIHAEHKGKGQGGVSRLHPLVDRNISTLHEEKFVTQLTGDEFYLSHHIINGQMILPGVAFIEMVRAAGEFAGEKHVSRLRDVTWMRPVILREKGQEIYTGLYPNPDSGMIDFEVSSIGKDGQRFVHAQGKLAHESSEEPGVNNEPVDIARIKQRCTNKLDGNTCYNLHWEKGLQLGPGFRVVQELFANETEVLALLKLPEELEEGLNDFTLHPALMDGALQSGIGLSIGREENSILHVPFAMGEVEILGPLPRICYVHFVVAGGAQANDFEGKRYDVRIMDEAGKVLVKMKDFVARPFRSSSQSTGLETGSRTEEAARMYFHGVWERKEIGEIRDQLPVTTGHMIIFDHRRDIFDAVRDRLARGNNARVSLVRPGECYQDLGDGIYQINPRTIADYQRLLRELEPQETLNIRIIHNWSQGSEADYVNCKDQEDINAQLDVGIYSLFYLSQALMQQSFGHKIKIEILYLYPGYEDGPLPQHAAVNGFAKTLPLEYARFTCKTVELERGTQWQQAPASTQTLDCILNELQAGIDEGVEISYRNGQRWVKVWKVFNLKREVKSLTPLKEKGVYLITGGMGGLGMIVARYLARELKAKQVLAGRSELDPEGQVKIRELEFLGSEVVYIKADVSKYEEVKHLIKEAKSRFKSINGIIHCAGITRDALLQNKKRGDVEEVLAPKVYGTIYLDEATKEENLDFFVLFSSISSVLGNVGQCDYAYANSFLDYYSATRENLRKGQKRSGKSFSINWPLWQEGGLKVDKQTEEFLQNTIGIKLLETEAGLKTFAEILTSDESQVMVLEGESQKIRQIVEKVSKLNMQGLKDEHHTEDKIQVMGDGSEFLRKIHKDVVRMVSGISTVKETRINVDKNLTENGFNSISFVELANQINKKYKLNISPALFFEYPSIDSFSQYVYKEFNEKILRYYMGNMGSTDRKVSAIGQEDLLPGKENNVRTRYQAWDFEVKQQDKVTPHGAEPIAIIGMSGVMPQSEDLDSFWANLEAGRDLITKVPEDRWEWGSFKEALAHENNPDRVIWGGFIKDVDKFDALFFGISPREAELMDPQQRIFLETVWKTIEDAGYKTSALSGTKTGLFVGVSTIDYADIVRQYAVKIEGHFATGLAQSVLANRISYLFDFHGPSEPIDTACSSALTAVHRAIESIRSGSCEMAIAGGINVLLTPAVFISFIKAGMLSEDGRCKTFDKIANGYVRGEGAGAIFLKPLSRAIRDGDHIYAVIKATAVNHGGHASSLTAPNMIAQSDLLIDVYEKAGVDPATISYIEAHGTGTSLGDPIEVDGLKRAFKELYKRRGQSPQEGYCGIGSVKTNIGHLEAAAGIAGLFKVLLAMKYKKLPATVHFKELNPYIQLDGSPFYIVRETKSWEKLCDNENQPILRRAGVSSFGFGGANAHVVLEEYENPTFFQSTLIREPQIIVLSAKNEERLKAYANKMVEFLEKAEASSNAAPLNREEFSQPSPLNFMDMAYTLQVGREPLEKRLAIIASSLQEVRQKLIQYCRGDMDIEDFFQGNLEESKSISEFLLEGKEGKEYLNIIIHEKKLEKLARLWVLGAEIDWKLLYQGQSPRRISLPTYPFAREQYWIAMNKPMSKAERNEICPTRHQEDDGKPWRDVLLAYESGQRGEALESYLNEQVSQVLKLSPTQKLDSKQPLVTMGLDSLMALQLKKQIEAQLHLDVSVIKFLGGESTADLVKLILPHLVGQEAGISPPSTTDEAANYDHQQNGLIEGVL